MNRNVPFNFYLLYFLKGWKSLIFHKGPIFLTFFITARCNANCRHCFYWQRINKIHDELTLKEIEKISISMPSFPKLLLSGGEPFLREDIDKICEIFYSNNKVRQITIPTNGILTKLIYAKMHNILEACKNAHIQIQISIDAIGEFHDKIRQSDGSFDRAMQTYFFLKKMEEEYKNFEINFCLTFSSLNQDFAKNTYQHISSKGSRNFSMLLIRGPVKDKSLLEFNLEKYTTLNRYIMQNSKFKNRSLSEYIFTLRKDFQTKIIEKVLKDENFKFRCTAGTLTAVIDETGLVYPCENWKNPFGSLRDENYNFKKIWNSPAAYSFRKKLSLDKCRCTHETNIMTNISFSPYFYMIFPERLLKLQLK